MTECRCGKNLQCSEGTNNIAPSNDPQQSASQRCTPSSKTKKQLRLLRLGLFNGSCTPCKCPCYSLRVLAKVLVLLPRDVPIDLALVLPPPLLGIQHRETQDARDEDRRPDPR